MQPVDPAAINQCSLPIAAENFNGAVDALIASGLLQRVLAQTEITFSNSIIESWWRA